MFANDEIEAAKKLFLELHSHRFNFLFQTFSQSDEWKSVVKPDGLSYKSYVLRDDQIIDVLLGGNTIIKTGFRNVRDVEYLSCRFGKFTRYFALDIDSYRENEYYNLETVNKICEITKHIGKPVFLTSSYTNGWHLRWYFTKEVKTFNLAVYLNDLFTKSGFIVQDGKLEIYPNVKSDPKALYKGLRLPCQRGSALLSLEDGRKIAKWEEGPEIFLVHWADEVSKNLVDTKYLSGLINDDFKNPKTKIWYQEYLELKEKGLSGPSQTNRAIGIMAKGKIVFEGEINVEMLTKALCEWIDSKHNNFSEEYNKSPQIAYNHCKRWAICALKKYKPLNKMIKKKVVNNSKRALSAQYDHQLEKVLKDGLISPEMSIRRIEQITGISKSVIQRKLSKKKVQCK